MEWSSAHRKNSTPCPKRKRRNTIGSQRRIELRQRGEDGALILDMLAAGRRSMAKRFHPDHGGSAEAMLHLNKLHDNLCAQVKRQYGIKTKRL